MLNPIIDLLRQTFKEWQADNVPRLAAALAYYIAFSLAPLLVIAIAVAGFILSEQVVREEVLTFIRSSIGGQAAELVGNLVDSLREPAVGIVSTILGLAALLFGAIGVFDQLKSTLDTVWGVEPTRQSSGIMSLLRGKLLSLVYYGSLRGTVPSPAQK